ncbi:PREDICTED: probable myosin-binding protein 5 [Camelina sativa]|uniref:Probable myosin-binding protein 5 n=1 Tax=Camelina sativa TaxID=90675 RepID=A0ABM0SWJ6_CAMSA|nr:PREDICTED: probable myosin-binding protein 5 [Camelina sativa]XP_010417160.1 PREDICTED: probable myosin-binding protein 5 [Camelina sativa]
MAGRSCSLDTRGLESTDLRIAFYEMKEDVERLEGELDTEREATASSVSEAMSMIRRLQGEKATLAMEASQYKRMVEERMSLAELSLELLEDLNYQKDVEIKNLECELHAYRCKLTSLGCNGLDEDYVRFCDRSQTPSPESIMTFPVEKGVIEQSLDSRRDKEKDKDLYWEEIKKLDEQLKELKVFRDSLRDQCNTLKQEAETKNGEKGLLRKPDLSVKKMSKNSSKQRRDRSVKRDHARGSCSANDAEYQAELHQLKERVELLEREKCNAEPAQAIVVKQENMNLQRKSEEELSSVQSTMFGYDSSTVSVQEAMLYFWL